MQIVLLLVFAGSSGCERRDCEMREVGVEGCPHPGKNEAKSSKEMA